MVTNNPEPNGDERIVTFTAKRGAAKVPRKQVAALRQKVIDLKTILVASVTGEELHELSRSVLALANAGNMEAAKWVRDTIIGTPIKSPELDACEDDTETEAPKVVLLDWRRHSESAPESN
jgi:hypothetical protein